MAWILFVIGSFTLRQSLRQILAQNQFLISFYLDTSFIDSYFNIAFGSIIGGGLVVFIGMLNKAGRTLKRRQNTERN